MNKYIILFTVFTLCACGQSDAPEAPDHSAPAPTEASVAKDLSKEQIAWKRVKEGAKLIDVRSQEEYDAGHFDQAILIAHDQILDGVARYKIEKTQSIVLYCKSGGRAERARLALLKAGYAEVFNAGGYEAMLQSKP